MAPRRASSTTTKSGAAWSPFPSSYGSTDELNDHHFHYGYFIGAAAAIARRDPSWTKNFGPFVDILVKDVANWERSDTRYPFLRHMDVYAGHSWANGPGALRRRQQPGSVLRRHQVARLRSCSGALPPGAKRSAILGFFLFANQVAAAEQHIGSTSSEAILSQGLRAPRRRHGLGRGRQIRHPGSIAAIQRR